MQCTIWRGKHFSRDTPTLFSLELCLFPNGSVVGRHTGAWVLPPAFDVIKNVAGWIAAAGGQSQAHVWRPHSPCAEAKFSEIGTTQRDKCSYGFCDRSVYVEEEEEEMCLFNIVCSYTNSAM